jgi:hypothetical protein
MASRPHLALDQKSHLRIKYEFNISVKRAMAATIGFHEFDNAMSAHAVSGVSSSSWVTRVGDLAGTAGRRTCPAGECSRIPSMTQVRWNPAATENLRDISGGLEPAGSAGRPPEQSLDAPALALGWTARAAVPDSHRDGLLAGRRGRAVVDVARGGSRCADTLGDDLLDDHDAVTSLGAHPHLITGPHGMRGLYPDPVDPDVPGPAGNGRSRPGPGQPNRPDPAVHPPSLITCHPATVMPSRVRLPPSARLATRVAGGRLDCYCLWPLSWRTRVCPPDGRGRQAGAPRCGHGYGDRRHTKAARSPETVNAPSRSITACTSRRTSVTMSAQGRGTCSW